MMGSRIAGLDAKKPVQNAFMAAIEVVRTYAVICFVVIKGILLTRIAPFCKVLVVITGFHVDLTFCAVFRRVQWMLPCFLLILKQYILNFDNFPL